jgi:hypothetical protein
MIGDTEGRLGLPSSGMPHPQRQGRIPVDAVWRGVTLVVRERVALALNLLPIGGIPSGPGLLPPLCRQGSPPGKAQTLHASDAMPTLASSANSGRPARSNRTSRKPRRTLPSSCPAWIGAMSFWGSSNVVFVAVKLGQAFLLAPPYGSKILTVTSS